MAVSWAAKVNDDCRSPKAESGERSKVKIVAAVAGVEVRFPAESSEKFGTAPLAPGTGLKSANTTALADVAAVSPPVRAMAAAAARMVCFMDSTPILQRQRDVSTLADKVHRAGDCRKTNALHRAVFVKWAATSQTM